MDSEWRNDQDREARVAHALVVWRHVEFTHIWNNGTCDACFNGLGQKNTDESESERKLVKNCYRNFEFGER